MKAKELKEKSKTELSKLLAEKREGVRKLRFDIGVKQVKNVRALRNDKKDIARILTLTKEKHGEE